MFFLLISKTVTLKKDVFIFLMLFICVKYNELSSTKFTVKFDCVLLLETKVLLFC